MFENGHSEEEEKSLLFRSHLSASEWTRDQKWYEPEQVEQ